MRAVRVTVPRFRERGQVPIQAMAPEGSRVKPGDMLLQVDNARLMDSLNIEQINLEKAEYDVARKQAEEESRIKDIEMILADSKLEFEKAALKAEIGSHLIPLREWQDNQFNYEKAKKEYNKTVQGLGLAQKAAAEELSLLSVKRDQVLARIAAIKSDLSALEILSTTTGTVVYENAPASWNSNPNDPPRKFQIGDQVSPGMVIMSVPDLTEMEARVFVSEVDGGLLKPGMRARIVADSYPEAEFFGTFEYIPEVAERIRRLSNVRVFIGRVRLDQTDSEMMKTGMSVLVEIYLDEQVGLILPRNAIFEENSELYVRHTTRGKIRVEVQARNASHYLIKGLAEGDTVELRN